MQSQPFTQKGSQENVIADVTSLFSSLASIFEICFSTGLLSVTIHNYRPKLFEDPKALEVYD